MSRNTFDDILSHLARPRGAPQAALGILDEFCAAVQRRTQDRITCLRTPGFVTNLGQEWRIILRAQNGFEHILFRAHVPATGFPVRLDLYDEDLVQCDDDSHLREALAEFLRRPATVEVIDTLGA